MNRKNRITALITALLLITVMLLPSCTAEKEQPEGISKKALAEKIENKTQAYMTDLMDSQSSFTNNDKIAKHLMNWAESKGIRVKEDDGIVVMNVDGSENYKNVPPTVIVCSYDDHYLEGSFSQLVLTLYAVKNNEDTGRLTALFVPESGNVFSSSDKLKKKYFKKGSRVFCLSGNESAIVSEITGGVSRYEFTNSPGTTRPKNNTAYKITIRGISSSHIDNKINSKINPIMELNTLLANLKKSNIDFEIVSFKGGRKDMLYPGSCSLVITVDEDREAAFAGRINRRIESFDKRKQLVDENAEYTYSKVSLPSRCFSQKDSSSLVGFVYTLLEDEYRRDEETDTLLAVCDVSYIRAANGKIRIGSAACSIDDETLSEIDDAEETLCGLSGYKYRKTASVPSWAADPENGFSDQVKKAYDSYTGKSLKIKSSVSPSNASYVSKLTDKCDILAMTVSPSTMTDLTGTVMQFLIDSNKSE